MRIAVDTGILVLHAFGLFSDGRYLERVVPSGIDRRESAAIAYWLTALLASHTIMTTPQVMVEFKRITQRELPRGLQEAMMRSYASFLARITEIYVPTEEILLSERDHESWWLCLTDNSLVMAARGAAAVLFTVDWPLYEFCRANAVSSRHLVEWYYEARL